jgi:5-dehydro-2-deoxygluconokinase
VAVAAVRLGHPAALISGVGDDPFGRFVRRTLGELGLDDRYVVVDPEHLTPVTLLRDLPPDDFPLYFYCRPRAPDLQVRPEDLDSDAVHKARMFWATVTGLSEQPSQSAHHAAWEARGQRAHLVLDLDFRPMFWSSWQEADGTQR